MTDSHPRHPIDPELVAVSLAETLCVTGGRRISTGDLVEVLRSAGIRVYAAGGAPRDWLGGAPAAEVDLCVDRDLERVHAVLRDVFPAVDPVVFHLERFGMLRWGDLAHVDLNILRSYRDIAGDSMWTTRFVVRGDLVEDARTRDFTINAFYYDFATATLLDPLHCGLEDLEQRRLRFAAHPRVLQTSYRMTLRIVQFIGRGYAPGEEVAAYLAERADRDVLGMGEERLVRWIGSRLGEGKLDLDDFVSRLVSHLRQSEARELLGRVVERVGSPDSGFT